MRTLTDKQKRSLMLANGVSKAALDAWDCRTENRFRHEHRRRKADIQDRGLHRVD